MKELPLLRTSERNDFKRCPWMWHKTWIEGLTPRQAPTWSWFGTAIHRALEVYYRPGRKRASIKAVLNAFYEAVEGQTARVYTEGGTVDEVEIVDARELGEAMLRGYIAFYEGDSDWEVIHTEQPFQIDVPHPTKAGRSLVVYAGTWDALMRKRSTGELWLWDHKTRRSFLKDWSWLEINDQAGSYLWVAKEVLVHKGLISKDDVIQGIVFNMLRKALPDPRPRNAEGLCLNKPKKEDYLEAFRAKNISIPPRATIPELERFAASFRVRVHGEVSKVQPAPLFNREEVYRSPAESVSLARRVQAEALAMRRFRTGQQPLYKTPTEECSRCKIFDLCVLDESSVEEGKEYQRSTMRKRDPYVDHREDMERGGIAL
jgi:hypothetical protein